MKKKLMLLSIFTVLALSGCKLKGDRGDKGDQGPGTIKIYSGPILSNVFDVTIPEIPTEIAQITAYIDNGSVWIELPFYIPAQGVNAYNYYAPSSNSGTMTFGNCQLAGALEWEVVVILK